MAETRSLPMAGPSALVVDGDNLLVYTSLGGQTVKVGHVPTDELLRFLGPECGLLPADWENEGPSAKRKTSGPVAVGGPYDGQRIPKTAYPHRRIRVPLRDPGWMRVLDESASAYAAAFWREGEYELVKLHGNGPMGEERELWWWKGELEPKPIADYGHRRTLSELHRKEEAP